VKWRQARRVVSEELPTLESALARLREFADGESDPSKREIAVQEAAVLERRIQLDREQFLS
jgi:hypothetical protein